MGETSNTFAGSVIRPETAARYRAVTTGRHPTGSCDSVVAPGCCAVASRYCFTAGCCSSVARSHRPTGVRRRSVATCGKRFAASGCSTTERRCTAAASDCRVATGDRSASGCRAICFSAQKQIPYHPAAQSVLSVLVLSRRLHSKKAQAVFTYVLSLT